jgi:2-polyprenyl-6-methoxyphenol hydroxylase-like FAD-dependent oxidoreductase
VLDADLVVDAAGRGSRAPDWLQALGYEVPSAEKVEVGIGYTTRLYRRKPEHAGGKLAVVVRGGAPDYRFGVALAQEDDSWIVSTGGYFGDAAPRDEEGLRAFVRSLPAHELGEIVGSAEPISSFRAYRFAASVRRRYERLARFPAGYLLIGDALCSFNPSYGQGMTTAALEATALDECLAGGTEALARRFFRAAARIIDIPWQIAVGNDLAHPQVVGKRTPMGRFFGWYIGKLHRAAARDGLLGTRFLEVANLMAPPTALLARSVALRVVRGNLPNARDTASRPERPGLAQADC